jgi:hypothetical protein
MARAVGLAGVEGGEDDVDGMFPEFLQEHLNDLDSKTGHVPERQEIAPRIGTTHDAKTDRSPKPLFEFGVEHRR